MSRPEVDESLEQSSIKVILTKDQEKSRKNKEWIRIKRSKCIESNGTCCCTGKFNIALSLCKVLGVALYFFKDFSEVATRESAVVEAL